MFAFGMEGKGTASWREYLNESKGEIEMSKINSEGGNRKHMITL